jgi:hypothetical protein
MSISHFSGVGVPSSLDGEETDTSSAVMLNLVYLKPHLKRKRLTLMGPYLTRLIFRSFCLLTDFLPPEHNPQFCFENNPPNLSRKGYIKEM